jgi:ABC-type multidrug transport system fused ATPase/permease subunit
VLVFDEATAALDNETEREITEAIHRLSRKKTIVCVAHRLRTIRESDVIHYVDRGRVLASGTYDELLQNSEEFKTMAEGKISRERAPEGAADGLAPNQAGE